MKIISVNVSSGKSVHWKGRVVQTGIFKNPIQGRVVIRRLNLDGDRQSDLNVHGGLDKAVYSYDMQDYVWWNEQLGRKLDPGAFGENLTTEGVLDREISVGDVLRIGTATLVAVQPRLPCYKLSVKFDDIHMTRRFMQAQRWGIYYRVLEEGAVEAGDPVEVLSREPHALRIADVARFATKEMVDDELLRRALAVAAMTAGWEETILELAKERQVTSE